MDYRPDEAARYLGITRKALANYTYQGRVGYTRIGRRGTTYTKVDLDTFRSTWKRHVPQTEMAQ